MDAPTTQRAGRRTTGGAPTQKAESCRARHNQNAAKKKKNKKSRPKQTTAAWASTPCQRGHRPARRPDQGSKYTRRRKDGRQRAGATRPPSKRDPTFPEKRLTPGFSAPTSAAAAPGWPFLVPTGIRPAPPPQYSPPSGRSSVNRCRRAHLNCEVLTGERKNGFCLDFFFIFCWIILFWCWCSFFSYFLSGCFVQKDNNK